MNRAIHIKERNRSNAPSFTVRISPGIHPLTHEKYWPREWVNEQADLGSRATDHQSLEHCAPSIANYMPP